MLDKYIDGEVTRISPEAPVQIVHKQKEFFRLGGAANVLSNLVNLNCIPYPIGAVGNDDDGGLLSSLLEERNILTEGIIIDDHRPTTVKMRILSNGYQLLRIDSERIEDIDCKIENNIIEIITKEIPICDAVILEDYNKGLMTPRIIEKAIKIANDNNKTVTVDPKYVNLDSYKNCTVFKPNKTEAERIANQVITSSKDVQKVAEKIFERISPEYLLITLAAEGMVLIDRDLSTRYFSAKARKVSDVSGAGDTVISVLTAGLAFGLSIEESIDLANTSAGIVVEKRGVVPIKINDFKVN